MGLTLTTVGRLNPSTEEIDQIVAYQDELGRYYLTNLLIQLDVDNNPVIVGAADGTQPLLVAGTFRDLRLPFPAAPDDDDDPSTDSGKTIVVTDAGIFGLSSGVPFVGSVPASAVTFDNLAAGSTAGTYTTPTLTEPVTGTLTVTIDGGTPSVNPFTAQALGPIVAALESALGPSATVALDGMTIVITSTTTGPSSSVRLQANSGAQAAGFVADSGVVTGADEILVIAGLGATPSAQVALPAAPTPHVVQPANVGGTSWLWDLSTAPPGLFVLAAPSTSGSIVAVIKPPSVSTTPQDFTAMVPEYDDGIDELVIVNDAETGGATVNPVGTLGVAGPAPLWFRIVGDGTADTYTMTQVSAPTRVPYLASTDTGNLTIISPSPAADVIEFTLTADIASWAASDSPLQGVVTHIYTQDSTGGRVITSGAESAGTAQITFVGGVPTLSAAAGKRTVIQYTQITADATGWLGVVLWSEP